MNNNDEINNAVVDLAKVKPSNDSNARRLYHVNIHRIEHMWARLFVIATDPKEAEAIATEASLKIGHTASFDSDVDIDAYVQEVKEGEAIHD